MNTDLGTHALADAIARFEELKRLGDKAIAQVDDAAFFTTSDAEANSIALVVKHVAGNLRSRWQNFLTEDGEKPTRDRDAEFELDAATDTRAALLERWEEGWAILFAELGALGGGDLLRTVTIRHEPHTVLQCVNRQLTHYGYHVGQIVLLARQARGAAWTSLSVPRRQSAAFNAAMKEKHAR
jgi:uncharacterized damage-inducible protein DinB